MRSSVSTVYKQIKMSDTFCICGMKTVVDEPVSTFSTVLEFLFSVVISICGVTVNYRFRKKLQEEKRNRPIGRKGNVIEPIMSWFCILQIIFWPYELSYLWIVNNEIIHSDQMPTWLCPVLYSIMRFGRMCVAYNSLFAALIRYLYIVHQQRSNQWDFEKTGKRFQIASISIPIAMETIGIFTQSFTELSKSSDRFEDCIVSYAGSNSTSNVELPTSLLVRLTMQYLPEPLVLTIRYIYLTISVVILMNITEAFLYLKVFQSMRR